MNLSARYVVFLIMFMLRYGICTGRTDKKCGIPQPPNNGKLALPCEQGLGSTCPITCNDGYILRGEQVMKCGFVQNQIKWDTRNIRCEAQKPNIKNNYLHINVRLNESVCIPCKLRNQYNELENKILVAWYKDGSPNIENVYPHYEREKDCLRIKKINSYDHGQFSCKAFNKYGVDEAFRFLNVTNRLPVHIPPVLPTLKIPRRTIPFFLRDTIEVTQKLAYKSIRLGRKLKIQCLLKGEPVPAVHWLFNGKKLVKSNRHKVRKNKLDQRNFVLIVRKFKRADIGKYTCVGSNSAGKVNMTYIVTLRRKPTPSPTPPTVAPNKVFVKEGENLTLTCKVPARDIIYLIWNVPTKPTSENSVERDFRGGDLGRDLRERNWNMQKYFPKYGYTKNGTRVEKSVLVNVTKEIHEGVYKCVGLLVHPKIARTFKVVEVVVEANYALEGGDVTEENMFPLSIVLPAACVAFFLLILFLCICFVFRQKSRQSKGLLIPIAPPPAQLTADGEEEDPSSMQILPMCNFNSLKTNSNPKNKRNSQRVSNDSIQDSKDKMTSVPCRTIVDINSISIHDRQKHSSTDSIRHISLSSNISLTTHFITSSSSTNNVKGLVEDTSHTSSPTTCSISQLDTDIVEDCSSCNENERLLVEHPCNVRTHDEDNDVSKNNSTVDMIDPDNLPPDKVTPSSMDRGGDLHMQLNFKNWEPLIRSNCPVTAAETRAVEEKLRSP